MRAGKNQGQMICNEEIRSESRAKTTYIRKTRAAREAIDNNR